MSPRCNWFNPDKEKTTMAKQPSKPTKPGFLDRLRKAFADYLKAVEKARQNSSCKGG